MFARARNCSSPASTVTSGLATRLWYQPGCFGAPALAAMTTRRSPATVYPSGVVRGRPLLAPVVVSSSRRELASRPPSLPPLARNSAIILWLTALGSARNSSKLDILAPLGVVRPARERWRDCDRAQ